MSIICDKTRYLFLLVLQFLVEKERLRFIAATPQCCQGAAATDAATDASQSASAINDPMEEHRIERWKEEVTAKILKVTAIDR